MQERITLSARHPFLGGHMVHGQHILPGLAYIDLLYQVFRKHGHDPHGLSLHHVAIYRPLAVAPDEPVQLEVSWTPVSEGLWKISIDGGSGGPPQRYITAEMRREPVAAPLEQRIDWPALRASAQRTVALEDIYARCREQGLVHTGVMRAEGMVHFTDDAVYVEARLGAQALEQVARVLQHPTLIDGCAVALSALDAGPDGATAQPAPLYLPLSYESFRASDFLRNACIAQIRLASVQQRHELRYLSIEFFDESGRQIAQLDRLAAKLVRNAQLLQPTPTQSLATQCGPDDGGGASMASAQAFVTDLLAQRIGQPVEPAQAHMGYYELGLGSVGLLELVELISARIGSPLPPTLLFEYPTIASLAAYLAQQHGHCFGREDGAQDARAQQSAGSEGPQGPVMPASVPPPQRAPCAAVEAEPIAIIGMSGRFPQAHNIEEFWRRLEAGTDCVVEVPEQRWPWQLAQGLRSPSGKDMSRWGGFIDDADRFDPQFFRISPREAEGMDPQERLFLEVCWEAMEDAGYTPAGLVPARGPQQRRHVGVFVGVMHKDYALLGAEINARGGSAPVTQSSASIANRVSFVCGFHGPSMAVDTLCSSSLVAVHLALQSLRRGESDVAFAGGVNLSLHPSKYLTYGMMDMHSSDGRCRSFGAGGDGYVSSEGVGAVLLKPLSRAQADGDHVYALIRASSTNHVGSASGFTVPSPVAQADMIVSCLESAGVDARSIGYVETHGTGTSLGDPIEIDGLTKAYRQFTDDRHFCAIGSVKSNIGHAESAAGVAGLIKVALQLQRRRLLPSLHSQQLNPHVDWTRSPFVVQQQAQDWPAMRLLRDGQETSLPRRAGLSSFGATGSNVHLILEEHAVCEAVAPGRAAVLVPLSAKSEEQLLQAGERLLGRLHQSDPVLADLAYTLQVGRVALEHRVAFVARDRAELLAQLEAFVARKPQIAGCHRGEKSAARPSAELPDTDDDVQELLRKWLAKGKLDLLAQSWARGLQVDWHALHAAAAPRQRISLPTYPFARERYWMPEPPGRAVAAPQQWLHPLLHLNTSTLAEQRFTSVFSGDEFFLRDHLVHGQRVLPGAAQLEMARAAAAAALGLGPAEASGLRLLDVAFVRPVIVDASGFALHVALEPADEGMVGFEIYSEAGSEVLVHSRGRVRPEPAAEAAQQDLQALLASRRDPGLDAQACYDIFSRMGLAYGPAHRALQGVWVGAAAGGEPCVVAQLRLPALIADTWSQYLLHPALLDASLQACVGMDVDPAEGRREGPRLPFALESLQVFAPIAAQAWVVVRRSPGALSGGPLQKLDIDVLDDAGRLCLRLSGFVVRAMKGAAASAVADEALLVYEEHWQPQAPVAAPAGRASSQLLCFVSEPAHQQVLEAALSAHDPQAKTVFVSHADLAAGDAASYRAALQRAAADHPALDTIVHLAAVEDSAAMQDYAGLVALVQAIAASGFGCRRLLLVGRGAQPIERCHLDAWIGFERSLKRVLPQTQVAVLGCNEEGAPAELLQRWGARLAGELQMPRADNVFYDQGVRQVLRLCRVEDLADTGDGSVLRHGGHYLLTGGLGGLGWIFAEHLVKTHGARVTLIGRSVPDADKTARLDALGAEACLYLSADVGDRTSLGAAITRARERFGHIDGVIHAAGIAPREGVLQATQTGFDTVLAPKIQGSLLLDELLADDAPDFICHFSSSSTVLGDFGVCSYSIGNRFQAAQARWCAHGAHKTLAISWPLWKDGGMSVGDAQETLSYLQSSGQAALETVLGLALFERLLAQPRPSLLVMSGVPDRIDRLLQLMQAAAEPAAAMSAASPAPQSPALAPVEPGPRGMIDDEALQGRAVRFLTGVLAQALKLPARRIEAGKPLAEYGIDSVMVMELTGVLERSFGPLSKTLFFEYQSIGALAEYFVRAHHDQLARLTSGVHADAAGAAVAQPAAVAEPMRPAGRRRVAATGAAAATPATPKQAAPHQTDGDIAVIGLGGRYPQADSPQALWTMLVTGTDGVTSVPADRWSLDDFYCADKAEAARTYRSHCRHGGFLEHIDRYDLDFFGISAAEAATIGPKELSLLETVWNLIESANYTRESLRASGAAEVGVFVGSMTGTQHYFGRDSERNPPLPPMSTSGLAHRISGFFDLSGPSLTIDTQSSSSATAVHLACESLRRGECAMAIAAGVCLLYPELFEFFSQMGVVGSRADSRSFADGDGLLLAEGVGAVLLKPLAQAEADGDQVLAVIRASAVRHAGSASMAPNPKVQAQLFDDVIARAGIDARTISYVESAAYGSPVGDLIEVAALSRAFAGHTSERQFCAIGSVKSNIGHAEAASGISQLTKVVLQMQHRQLAPLLPAERLNPNLRLEETPFYLQTRLEDWHRPRVVVNGMEQEVPRRAMVNSFGAGGAYASLLLEEHGSGVGTAAGAHAEAGPQLVLLSARTPGCLKRQAQRLSDHLVGTPSVRLIDLAYTLQVGREAMSERLAMVAGSIAELLALLQRVVEAPDTAAVADGSRLFFGRQSDYETAVGRWLDRRAEQTVVEQYLAQRQLPQLANYWVNGSRIDWAALHATSGSRRILLPTYPFERQTTTPWSHLEKARDLVGAKMDSVLSDAQTSVN